MIIKYKKNSHKAIGLGLFSIIIIAALWLTNSTAKSCVKDAKTNQVQQTTNIKKADKSKDEIQFKDKVLENAIRVQIDKTIGKILKSDVLSIKILDLSCLEYQNIEIKSLEGMQHLKNLRILTLPLSSPKELLLLKNSSNLKIINISTNYDITDKELSDLKKSFPTRIIEVKKINSMQEPKIDNAIKRVGWNGIRMNHSSNHFKPNEYRAEFKGFQGKDLYMIKTEKVSYDIKMNSKINSGTITMKVYNNEELLFEKVNPVNEKITISDKNATNVRIECTGKDASGSFSIKTV